MDTNTNIFEMASQSKYRYPYKGQITTEDLWDLTPAQLDTVYQNLTTELNASRTDSLMTVMEVAQGVKVNELKNKIEIVKYIFNHKKQAAELNRKAAENAAKKQHILEILAAKQDAALQNQSEEELLQMLNELG